MKNLKKIIQRNIPTIEELTNLDFYEGIMKGLVTAPAEIINQITQGESNLFGEKEEDYTSRKGVNLGHSANIFTLGIAGFLLSYHALYNCLN